MLRLFATLLLLIAPLVLTSACEFSSDEAGARNDAPVDGAEPDPMGGGGGGGAPEFGCQIDSDCMLAASTCCECPSFAVSLNGGFGDSCEEVDCEEAVMCPAIVPRCDQNQCQIACAAIVTNKSCEFGFDRDTAGCLVDECESVASLIGCTEASECVQIPSDCCGCGRGGADQAVLAGEAASATEELACTGNEICPEIDVCDIEESPQCVAGSCVLTTVDIQDVPPGQGPLCGGSGLEACADGFVCLLNKSDAENASTLGVGVCVESL